MTPLLSFMSANYVARELGFRMTAGWSQGSDATAAFFRPADTYEERLDALLASVRALGFEAVDLWTAHLGWAWAGDDHVAAACRVLGRHGLTVPTLAGGFGDTPEQFRRACAIACAVGAGTLAGSTPLLASDRAELVAALRDHGLRFALENHPERTPAELLARAGEADTDVIGVCVDTGWFATQRFAPAEALAALGSRLYAVHLKDILPPRWVPGSPLLRDAGHATCTLGDGVADIPACVRTLCRLGYTGPVSLEHEPELEDPTDDLRVSLGRVSEWFRKPNLALSPSQVVPWD